MTTHGYGEWRRQGTTTLAGRTNPSADNPQGNVTYNQWRRETPGGGEENILLSQGENPPDDAPPGSVGVPRSFDTPSSPEEADLNKKLKESRMVVRESVPIVEFEGKRYPQLAPGFIPKAALAKEKDSGVRTAYFTSDVLNSPFGGRLKEAAVGGFGGYVKGEEDSDFRTFNIDVGVQGGGTGQSFLVGASSKTSPQQKRLEAADELRQSLRASSEDVKVKGFDYTTFKSYLDTGGDVNLLRFGTSEFADDKPVYSAASPDSRSQALVKNFPLKAYEPGGIFGSKQNRAERIVDAYENFLNIEAGKGDRLRSTASGAALFGFDVGKLAFEGVKATGKPLLTFAQIPGAGADARALVRSKGGSFTEQLGASNFARKEKIGKFFSESGALVLGTGVFAFRGLTGQLKPQEVVAAAVTPGLFKLGAKGLRTASSVVDATVLKAGKVNSYLSELKPVRIPQRGGKGFTDFTAVESYGKYYPGLVPKIFGAKTEVTKFQGLSAEPFSLVKTGKAGSYYVSRGGVLEGTLFRQGRAEPVLAESFTELVFNPKSKVTESRQLISSGGVTFNSRGTPSVLVSKSQFRGRGIAEESVVLSDVIGSRGEVLPKNLYLGKELTFRQAGVTSSKSAIRLTLPAAQRLAASRFTGKPNLNLLYDKGMVQVAGQKASFPRRSFLLRRGFPSDIQSLNALDIGRNAQRFAGKRGSIRVSIGRGKLNEEFVNVAPEKMIGGFAVSPEKGLSVYKYLFRSAGGSIGSRSILKNFMGGVPKGKMPQGKFPILKVQDRTASIFAIKKVQPLPSRRVTRRYSKFDSGMVSSGGQVVQAFRQSFKEQTPLITSQAIIESEMLSRGRLQSRTNVKMRLKGIRESYGRLESLNKAASIAGVATSSKLSGQLSGLKGFQNTRNIFGTPTRGGLNIQKLQSSTVNKLSTLNISKINSINSFKVSSVSSLKLSSQTRQQQNQTTPAFDVPPFERLPPTFVGFNFGGGGGRGRRRYRGGSRQALRYAPDFTSLALGTVGKSRTSGKYSPFDRRLIPESVRKQFITI